MPDFPETPFAPVTDQLDWWVKIVGMLQQNWALPVDLNGKLAVLFVGDTSGIFDRIDFESERELFRALRINGFVRFAADPELQSFLSPPPLPLDIKLHQNGFIYSSGQYWVG